MFHIPILVLSLLCASGNGRAEPALRSTPRLIVLCPAGMMPPTCKCLAQENGNAQENDQSNCLTFTVQLHKKDGNCNDITGCGGTQPKDCEFALELDFTINCNACPCVGTVVVEGTASGSVVIGGITYTPTSSNITGCTSGQGTKTLDNQVATYKIACDEMEDSGNFGFVVYCNNAGQQTVVGSYGQPVKCAACQ